MESFTTNLEERRRYNDKYLKNKVSMVVGTIIDT